jgi:hypothetical protein
MALQTAFYATAALIGAGIVVAGHLLTLLLWRASRRNLSRLASSYSPAGNERWDCGPRDPLSQVHAGVLRRANHNGRRSVWAISAFLKTGSQSMM